MFAPVVVEPLHAKSLSKLVNPNFPAKPWGPADIGFSCVTCLPAELDAAQYEGSSSRSTGRAPTGSTRIHLGGHQGNASRRVAAQGFAVTIFASGTPTEIALFA